MFLLRHRSSPETPIVAGHRRLNTDGRERKEASKRRPTAGDGGARSASSEVVVRPSQRTASLNAGAAEATVRREHCQQLATRLAGDASSAPESVGRQQNRDDLRWIFRRDRKSGRTSRKLPSDCSTGSRDRGRKSLAEDRTAGSSVDTCKVHPYRTHAQRAVDQRGSIDPRRRRKSRVAACRHRIPADGGDGGDEGDVVQLMAEEAADSATGVRGSSDNANCSSRMSPSSRQTVGLRVYTSSQQKYK